MSGAATFTGALGAAAAAWLSTATLGFTGAAGVRLAILPLSVPVLLLAAAAAAAVVALRRAGASLVPLTLLGFLVLPWLPLSLPSAFLLWVWPLSLFLWMAVLLLMLVSLPRDQAVPGAAVRSPRIAAGAIAAVIFASSAWGAAPMTPEGDEPHYLVITQSLLLDGSLTIENVHRRGDYRAYYRGELQPHWQRLGQDGRMYSLHAPGLPVLVAPAFALGGHRGVMLFLVLMAAAGSALAWHCAWLAARRTDAAWFAWAAVTLPATAIFQSFMVYPDGPGGVLALTGLWALLRAEEETRDDSVALRPWVLHGAALALLPWLHSRFAVLAAAFGSLILLRLGSTKNPAGKAVAFLSIPAISAVVWAGFFVAIYGRPDPSAPYGPGGNVGSFAFVPGGLAGLLFDQRFGLITYAPVVAVAFAGLAAMCFRPPFRRLALELLFVIAPYLITVTHFAMWWGGFSPPARFFAPVLPLFAVPAAVAWTLATRRVTRVLAAISLVLTAFASVTVVFVYRGRLAFNTRDVPSLWLEWLGRLADLTTAAPGWARDADLPLFRAIAIWVAVAVAAILVLRLLERRLGGGRALPTVAVAIVAVGVMVASTAVWAVQGTNGRTISRSQLALLETASTTPRAIALQLTPWAPLPLADVPGRLRIELVRALTQRRGGGESAPLFALPAIPAGRYRLSAVSDDPRGWLMVGIARDPRDPFALQTVPVSAGPIDLRVPVAVRSLVIRGDEDARRTVHGLLIEPLEVTAAPPGFTNEVARRAVRYAPAFVYFMDERSWPEPQAFWVGGSRDSTVVVQPVPARRSVILTLRNAPVENRVTLASHGWEKVLTMAAGEEQRIEIPMAPGAEAVPLRITASSGFRPSEVDAGSRDQRFLGVWVKVEGE
jgi:hypothetical protein